VVLKQPYLPGVGITLEKSDIISKIFLNDKDGLKFNRLRKDTMKSGKTLEKPCIVS
jgi:hypothetical protein